MRDMTIKIFLIGLALFVCKAPTLAQNQDADIRCEVGGLNFNLSQDEPGYGFDFGSFSVFADGKEKEGGTYITKSYKLPRINLILSVSVGYIPKSEELNNQLIILMVLSKKRVPFSSESEFGKFFDNDVMTKNVIDTVQVIYSMKTFEGSEGIIVSMPFLGKRKPVSIVMKCKKVKKEDK